jgi:hypothetical protein
MLDFFLVARFTINYKLSFVLQDANDNESKMSLSKQEQDMLSNREIITRRILRQQHQQVQQQVSASNITLPLIPVSPIRAISPGQTPSPHPSPGGRTIINPERDNYNVDKILDCWQCGLHFATRKMLLRHLKEHNIDYPFKCYLCDASYQFRRDCLNHKTQKHPDDWIGLKARNKIDDIADFVEVMEKLTENPDEKTDEMKKDGDDIVAAVERKVFCALCPKKFWSLQDLRRHMRSHTGMLFITCSFLRKVPYIAVGNNRSIDSSRSINSSHSIDPPFRTEHVQWELSMCSENYGVHVFQREKEDYLRSQSSPSFPHQVL